MKQVHKDENFPTGLIRLLKFEGKRFAALFCLSEVIKLQDVEQQCSSNVYRIQAKNSRIQKLVIDSHDRLFESLAFSLSVSLSDR